MVNSVCVLMILTLIMSTHDTLPQKVAKPQSSRGVPGTTAQLHIGPSWWQCCHILAGLNRKPLLQ